ncbi:MAG: YdcF family protein, partial [Chitinophagaceae bacterium]|nr:YdcF family protein [Chitinophagaceae bacterium]
AIIIILVVFTNPLLFRTATLQWQPEPVQLDTSKIYSAGIVLGGMAGYDRYDRGYFGASADRFIQTANLYHRGIIKKIIITGGTGSLRQNDPPESIFLRTAFMDNGIPDSALVIESRSRNTYENAVFTKQITDSLHLRPPFLLITSAIHMRRSESVFRKAGFNFASFPCDYKITPSRPEIENFILPNIALLNEWSYLLKEMVGLWVYKLTGKA